MNVRLLLAHCGIYNITLADIFSTYSFCLVLLILRKWIVFYSPLGDWLSFKAEPEVADDSIGFRLVALWPGSVWLFLRYSESST